MINFVSNLVVKNYVKKFLIFGKYIQAWQWFYELWATTQIEGLLIFDYSHSLLAAFIIAGSQL